MISLLVSKYFLDKLIILYSRYLKDSKTNHVQAAGGASGKNPPPVNAGDIELQVQSLIRKDLLEDPLQDSIQASSA